MEKHPDVATGYSKKDKATQDQLWSELTESLNSCGPQIRSMQEWRKTWTDCRRNVKTKLAHNKLKCKTTGGGQHNKYVITPLEERIAVLCGLYTAVGGINGTKTFGTSNKENVEELPQNTLRETTKDDGTSSRSAAKSPTALFLEQCNSPTSNQSISSSVNLDITPIPKKKKKRSGPDVELLMQ
ncbi:uncharacterized protein [Musca autumnalis]|uniref:uncharacterized protein n=1 Tax=Musca autumnalis TaxID=221902 RepID=UPI003CF4350C